MLGSTISDMFQREQSYPKIWRLFISGAGSLLFRKGKSVVGWSNYIATADVLDFSRRKN